MTTGSLDGQVAFITGAARGMGRAHAVKLASEGADIIAVDVCTDFTSTDYPGATAEDLAATVKLVEGQGRRIVAREADVRDADAVDAVVAEGLQTLGRLDIVIANAGIIRVTDSDRTSSDLPGHRRSEPHRRMEHRRRRDTRPRRRAGEADPSC